MKDEVKSVCVDECDVSVPQASSPDESTGASVCGPEMAEGRILTFGEKAVGLTFNPGNNPDVDEVKRLYAAIIDKLNDMRGADRSERARLCSVAITEAQTAQMWAVKAITWKN